jgi:hypothetical protein
MITRKISLEHTDIDKQVANFTVGFLKFAGEHDEKDAIPAGSGSLVLCGSVHGILTAAHVLKHLPDAGEVGIVRFTNAPPSFQKRTIKMEYTEKLIISANEDGPNGPDLGFLRLPESDAVALQLTNVFMNLDKRRDAILAGRAPAGSYVADAIVGVIGEWTEDLPPKQKRTRLKGLTALFGAGEVISERQVCGYDLLDFSVNLDFGFKSPSSYAGTSGGAVWRFFVDVAEDRPKVLERWLFGVPFYESHTSEGKLIISCHGPRSFYAKLFERIGERWRP